MVPSAIERNCKEYDCLDRLLNSAATTLRDAMGDDYGAIKHVVDNYLGSPRWIDEIPAMAEQWREKATGASST